MKNSNYEAELGLRVSLRDLKTTCLPVFYYLYYTLEVVKIMHAQIKFERNEIHVEQQIMIYEALDIEFTALEWETYSALENTQGHRRSI